MRPTNLVVAIITSCWFLALLTSAWAADDCTEECGTGEQDPVAFLQLKSKVQSGRDAGEISEPIPIGRTFISSNPTASAEFFVKYFVDARGVSLPPCDYAERAAVELNIGEDKHVLFAFIEDTSLPAGQFPPAALTPIVRAAATSVFAGELNSSMWTYNHDAFDLSIFRYEKAVVDGVVMQGEKASGDLRLYIPHTLWTVDFTSADFLADPFSTNVSTHGSEGSDGCMDMTLSFTYSSTWMKATFLAAHPEAAMDFAVKILGAEAITSPSAWPPKEGCTASKWVQFPKSGMHMHFEFPFDAETHAADVVRFATSIENLRNLKAGVFDAYMHDSWILAVDSLDPYLDRLRSEGLPFFLTSVGGGQYALFTDIPKNGITIQLRSSEVSAAEVVSQAICTEQLQ